MIKAAAMKLQILFFCAAAGRCFAQFYAPPTDFHDPSQRVFPVEAARVIAWQLREPTVDHVSYQLTQSAKGDVTWKISWDDAQGKAVRTAAVVYKESDLLGGAKWYRSVWRQLRGPVPKPAKATGSPLPDFWKAHAEAGTARTECIASAFKATESLSKSMTDIDAAKVAGCLTRTLAASSADQIFLGAVVSARSAAWLCSAEDLSGVSLGSPWVPVLSASGRNAQAAEVLKSAPAELAGNDPVKWMWRTLVTNPPASQALVEAVANRECAGPVFMRYGNMEPAYNDVLVEIMDKLWPGKLKDRMCDFGSSIIWARKAHQPPQEIPMRTIKLWLDALEKSPPQPGDSAFVRKLADASRDKIRGKNDLKSPEPALIELLSLGARVNSSPLRPVAVVTQDDFLGFGWEAAGKQVGSIHARMTNIAGYGEKTTELVAAWPSAVDGWNAFFRLNSKAAIKPLEDSGRYEFTVFGNIGRHLGIKPPTAWGKDPFAHFKRRWMLDPHRALVTAREHDGDAKTTAELLRRAIAEGGPNNLGPLAEKWENEDIDELADELGFRSDLARAVPASLYSARMTMEATFHRKHAPLAYAQALEKLHWDSGLTFATVDVMLAYAQANAVEDALRFFSQVGDAIPNWMDRFKAIHIAVALALIEGKDDAALAILDKYEKEDRFGLRFEYALARGDKDGVQRAYEINKKNFPKASRIADLEKAIAWLPLYPALRDPKHPDHQRALTEFPRSRGMQLAQWLLFTRAKLPDKSAAAFFESEKSEDADKLIIASFNKDAALFEKLYTEGVPTVEEVDLGGGRAVFVVRGFPVTSRGSSGTDALMSWLRGQLGKQPRHNKPTDLRPEGGMMLFPKLRALLDATPAK